MMPYFTPTSSCGVHMATRRSSLFQIRRWNCLTLFKENAVSRRRPRRKVSRVARKKLKRRKRIDRQLRLRERMRNWTDDADEATGPISCMSCLFSLSQPHTFHFAALATTAPLSLLSTIHNDRSTQSFKRWTRGFFLTCMLCVRGLVIHVSRPVPVLLHLGWGANDAVIGDLTKLAVQLCSDELRWWT